MKCYCARHVLAQVHQGKLVLRLAFTKGFILLFIHQLADCWLFSRKEKLSVLLISFGLGIHSQSS